MVSFRRIRVAWTHEEAGFSLLEVVIAMAIMGLALAGLVGGLAVVFRVSQTMEEQTVSESLATRHVEEYLLSEKCPLNEWEVEDEATSCRVVWEEYAVECDRKAHRCVVTALSDSERLLELSIRGDDP